METVRIFLLIFGTLTSCGLAASSDDVVVDIQNVDLVDNKEPVFPLNLLEAENDASTVEPTSDGTNVTTESLTSGAPETSQSSSPEETTEPIVTEMSTTVADKTETQSSETMAPTVTDTPTDSPTDTTEPPISNMTTEPAVITSTEVISTSIVTSDMTSPMASTEEPSTIISRQTTETTQVVRTTETTPVAETTETTPVAETTETTMQTTQPPDPTTEPTPPPSSGLSAGAVVGIVFGVLIVLLLIILIILVLNSWFNFIPHTPAKLQHLGDTIYRMPSTSKPVPVDEFEYHVQQMSADQNRRFAEEFDELSIAGKDRHTHAAHMEVNQVKNRFINILPYDHSRVKLMPSEEDGSDYINANWMPGVELRREYICTQGPLPHTQQDFWRMVWEHNCTTIVMLTKVKEKMRIKCEQYWPTDKEPLHVDDITLQNETVHVSDDWVVRKIAISKGCRLRHVLHLHYTAWPDMGVPDTDSLLDFLQVAQQEMKTAPYIIHCSAGVGRTGAFIAIDRLTRQILEDYTTHLDVYGTVYEMRDNRTTMVQTEAQYVFVHECVVAYLDRLNAEESTRDSLSSTETGPLYVNVNDGFS